ncbi:DUF4293 domain-containing protein [Saprospiraceae bacterium]|nr:DUF4293 domain-containing protein [Saprospiraceae bacterium]
MIQRIQSIFLLLASGSLFSLFGIPFATSDQQDTALFADKVYNLFDNPLLIALTCIAGAIAFINIFLFKKRNVQLKLDYLVITFSILLTVLAVFFVFKSGGDDASQIVIKENYLGLAMPLVAVVFAALANRSIGKDNKLVKSMDRLR